MYNIAVIAKVFLSFSSMTQKKLQKLCYYAQAHYLERYNNKLMDTDFEAWVHGPVSPELYSLYKNYNWSNIPKNDLDIYLPDEILVFLKDVFNTYNKYDANELEEKTHNELPWIEARGNLNLYDSSNNIINVKTMKQFYSKNEYKLA